MPGGADFFQRVASDISRYVVDRAPIRDAFSCILRE